MSAITLNQVPPGLLTSVTAFEPLPDDMAPQMKSALIELRKALTEPPSMGDQWPFALPPAMQALLDPPAPADAPSRPGRPVTFKPAHAVQLVRWVGQGSSVRAAAKRAGIPERTARRILSGQTSAANLRAITGAGYTLPAVVRQTQRQTPKSARQAPETTAAGVDAPQGVAAPQSGGGPK